MSNLIDKEKVIELLTDEMENWHFIVDKIFLEGCIDEISKMPPVDAEPVVRCKDCSNHGKSFLEDAFLEAGENYGYCYVGKLPSICI